MGMEGKLRRISEFELAAYRKNPAKLYSALFPASASPIADFGKIESLIEEVQKSPVGRRIRERTLAGENPFQEDTEALQLEMQNAFKQFPQFATAMANGRPGLGQDGKQLSLHKSWGCLHFLFTGRVWETDNSLLSQAIMGGAEIPDVQGVMGYGPLRYLSPAEVQKIHEALNDFPIEVRAREYDPQNARTAKVYVPDHGTEELIQYFNWVLEFYGEASRNGEAVLLWVQ
jgi:hypothetical protein